MMLLVNSGRAVYDDTSRCLVARRLNLEFTKYTHARQEKKGKAERFNHRRRPLGNGFGRGAGSQALRDQVARREAS